MSLTFYSTIFIMYSTVMIRSWSNVHVMSTMHLSSLQYMVREHMVEEGMTHHLKSAGHSIIRKCINSIKFVYICYAVRWLNHCHLEVL